MSNASGSLTSSQGYQWISSTPNDALTITINPSATYSLESPLGTFLATGATTTQTLYPNGPCRLIVNAGAVTWSLVDNPDTYPASGIDRSLPAVVDVTRNSANDTTDSTPQVLGTLVIAPNALRIGSIVEVWALFENTNSASTKTFIGYINGNSFGTASNTTNQAFGIRQPIHVHDANTLVLLNNFGSPGNGATGAAASSKTVTGVCSAGFTLTLGAYWGANNIASEFIRLKFAKLNIIY